MPNVIRRLSTALVACTLLSHSALAQTFYGPRLRSGSGENSLKAEEFFDRQAFFLESTRGVLMQSLATFLDGKGNVVSPLDVSVEVVGSAQDQIPCLRIAGGPCARFQMSAEQVKAILRFVQNGRYRALTLPADAKNRKATQRIISQIELEGMVRVGDGSRPDWVAKELANSAFVRILRYIDYDEPFDFTDPQFEANAAKTLRDELNAKLGHVTAPTTPIEDSTWVNADLHANFGARASEGSVVCDGLPARYEWALHVGKRFAYVTDVSFAAPASVAPLHRRFFMDAQSLFCTTSILRALNAKNPKALADLHK